MLSSLHIRNLALVQELDLELSAGLNTVTGETGAGKSLVIGAIQWLAGARASGASIRKGEKSCEVSAVLRIPEEYAALMAKWRAFAAENGIPNGDDERELLLRRVVTENGSRAFVEIHDYIDPGEDETFGDPANVVADFDGLLLSLQAHSGKPAARVGSGVCKGDLLISGVTVDRYGQAHFYEARGKATALHDDVLELEGNAQSDFIGYEKVQTVPAVRLFHVTVPLGMFSLRRDFDVFTCKRQAELGGVPLPLWLIRQTRCYRTARKNEDALSLLLDDHTRASEEKYAATNVLDAALTIERKKETLRLTEESRCIDFIGVEKELGVGE